MVSCNNTSFGFGQGGSDMQSWATHEFRYVQLGDTRLNKRLVKMVEDLSSQPAAVFHKHVETGLPPKELMSSGRIPK